MNYTYEIRLYGNTNPLMIFILSKSPPFSSISVSFPLLSLFKTKEEYNTLANLNRHDLESTLLKSCERYEGSTLIKFTTHEDRMKDNVTKLFRDNYSNRITDVFKRLLVAKESFNSNYLKSRECI